ncbi:MAG TPA: outer membrane protein assembly factor BamA [Xanthobacteraceae bacterium]|nr:outer membrane protein assembly factor BamA [Xanthobacteraceae bacterium]
MDVWVRLIRGLGVAGLILAGSVLCVVAIAVATTDIAVAQSADSIVVQGNRRVEADTIRSYFRPGPGQRLDAAKIDEALKALYATGLFQDVHVNQTGVRLVVTVVENAVINRVAFEGNKKVKDDQLQNEVQSKPRGTLSRSTVQADVQRITEIYRRNGRYDVRVEPKIIELPNGRVDLVFEIKEGDKIGIKTIRFVGNNSYSSSRLKEEIKTAETGLLAFLQTTDIYDPDRIEADRDLLRRFYLKHGFADVRIVSAVGEYDPEVKRFIITFTIEEGPQYRFGKVDIQSNVRAVPAESLRPMLRTDSGAIYNAEAVEKSVEFMSIDVAKRGYPFAVVRPRGERDPATKRINLVYTIDEGSRIYIERINIRGNVRTRDYVIRREFDIAEGDAYNRALVDRAERRLKNLNYFKNVKITTEPGSASDRVVLNVDVEEMPTGEIAVAAGYSTADGVMGEFSIGDRNLLGRGQIVKAAIMYGQRARGFELSYLEPYLLGYRMSGGVSLFARQTLASSYYSYDNRTIGSTLSLGFGLSEEWALQLRYSIYQQEITLPLQLNDCIYSSAAKINGGTGVLPSDACYTDGEASLAVRKELAAGAVMVSLLGYSVIYNTLDNNKNPSEGLFAEFRQDFAGVGGDVNFIRTTADARAYHEVFSDVVSVLHLQGGYITGWGSKDLRMLDHFQMGPNLVRGFEPAGFGPRDLTFGTSQDSLGGTMYWGASVEAQTPVFILPKDAGVKAALFADAGSLWGYKGPTSWDVTGETISPADSKSIRASVGVGVLWASPFGPLRFDFAIPVMKQDYDRTQQFRFSGGTRF